MDLAVVNTNPPPSISILLGNGDGTFGTAANFPAGGPLPFSVEVGDFNSDGILDLAVSNLNSDNVSIFLGNGNGTFGTATNFQVGDAPRSLTVGDFNGDTILDLATANQASNTVSILLGNGNGTFDAANNFPAGGIEPFDIAVGDFTSTTSTPPSIDNTDTLAIIKNKSCQPDSQICEQNISQPSDFTIFPIPSPFS